MTTEPAKPPPPLRGDRVLLRAARPSDRDQRLRLGRDPEFHRLVGGDPSRAHRLLSEWEVARWYDALAGDPLHWAMEVQGCLIGTARLHALDPANRRARYAVGIFAAEHRARGYGTEATHLVLSHAFRDLGLHRVELRVLEFNQAAIAMYARCGFVREGVEREGALIGGRWHSDVLMSILEQEHPPPGRG